MEETKKKEHVLSCILLFGPAALQTICLITNYICINMWEKYGEHNQLTQYGWINSLASSLLLIIPLLCIILQIIVFNDLRKINISKAGAYLGIGLLLSIIIGFFAFIVRCSLF